LNVENAGALIMMNISGQRIHFVGSWQFHVTKLRIDYHVRYRDGKATTGSHFRVDLTEWNHRMESQKGITERNHRDQP
jgi:hypothetical protein